MALPSALDLAQAAFAAVLAEGVCARLEAVNVETEPEYNVVLGDGLPGHGLIHEQIVALIKIAESHEGRLFLQDDEPLVIVWPLSPGSVGPGTHADRPVSLRTKIEAHNGRPPSRAGRR